MSAVTAREVREGYVYIRSEPGLWTVGFYDPAGDWQPESDHGSTDAAARRVAFLNGGPAPQLVEALRFYMTICGNTAAVVDRESAGIAYEQGRAALAAACGEVQP
jgi:hypothetical protein